MILTLVERYIFRKAFLATAMAAGALIGVLWVVRAVQTVDVILSKGQGISTYLKMTSLGVPSLAAAIAPLALLIGLVRTINALNDDSELVVLHASGASRTTLLKPFLVLSLLVMGIVYFLHLWAGPYSMRVLRSYVTQVRADLVSVVVQEGTFKKVGQGLTFHVAERAPGGLLKGVFILDGRDKNETFTYLAKEGAIAKSGEDSFLVLQDGQIHRYDNASGKISIIKFNSYAFNLSSFSGGKNHKKRGQSEIPTYELFFPDKNEKLYKHAPNRYTAEFHTRLTGGLYPLLIGLVVLAYLGNPTSHRQGQGLIIATACGVIMGLRAITIYAEGAMRGNTDLAYLAWGVPLIAIAFACFLLATDRSAFSYRALAWFQSVTHALSNILKNNPKNSSTTPSQTGAVS